MIDLCGWPERFNIHRCFPSSQMTVNYAMELYYKRDLVQIVHRLHLVRSELVMNANRGARVEADAASKTHQRSSHTSSKRQ